MGKNKSVEEDFLQINHWRNISFKTVLCIVFTVSFLCYSNTLNADFVYDDTRAILTNEDLRPEKPLSSIFYNDFWGTPLSHSGSHKSYRPLCVLTFRLNYMIGELNPFGYHLVNVMFHCLVSCLFTIYCFKLFEKEWLTLLGGLLFAVHPIHTEAVAGIVGRADVGAAAFFLLSLISYHNAVINIRKGSEEKTSNKFWFLLSLLSALFSMYMKEQGVTVLGVLVVYELLIISKCNFGSPLSVFETLRQSGGSTRIAVIIINTFCLLYTRLLIMGNSPPEFAPSDNPAANHENTLTRFLTFLYLPSVNLWLLFYPWNLNYDYSMDSIPLVESIFSLENLCTILLYGSLLFIAYLYLKYNNSYNYNNNNQYNTRNNKIIQTKRNKQTNIKTTCKQLQQQQYNLPSQKSTDVADNLTWNAYNILILSLALLILPFLPATNLFFYVGFVIAERILYIPSIGFCLLVTNGLDVLLKMYSSKQKHILVMLSAILLSFVVKTFDRNFVWKNEESLYRSGLEMSPAKCFSLICNDNADFTFVYKGYMYSILHDGIFGMQVVYTPKNRTKEAEHAYRSALKYRGNMADAHYNLGILLQKEKRLEEAVQSYEAAIKFRPRLASAHLNLGVTLRSMGQQEKALQVLMNAYNISDHGLKDPATHASALTSIRYNAGMTLFDLGRYNESIEIFLDALKKMPDNYEPHSIYNMLGQAYASQNMTMYAESWYLRSIHSKDDHVPALLAYANLLKDSKDREEVERSEENYKKALKIDPSRAESYLLYSAFLVNSNRFKKGISVLEKLLKKHPKNLQAMNHISSHYRNINDYENAEKYQVMAVKAYPERADLFVNLGALYHLMDKLDEATVTYEKALKLQPNNELLLDNMQRLDRAKKKKERQTQP